MIGTPHVACPDEQRFQRLFEHMPGMALALDLEGRIIDANRGAEQIIGLPRGALHGRDIVTLVPAWDDGGTDAAVRLQRLVAFERHEVVARRADGDRRHLTATLVPELIDGACAGFLLLATDITRLVRTTRQLQVQADVIDHSHDAVAVLDEAGRVVTWNRGAERLYGMGADAMLGQRFETLLSPCDWQLLQDAISRCDLGGSTPCDLQLRVPRRDGEASCVLVSLSRIPAAEGRRELVAVYGLDVAALRSAEEALRYDCVTGLPNRALMLDFMRQAMVLAQRGARVPAALMIVLDDFHEVAGALGGAAGDELLRLVAQRLKSCLRAGDVLSRLGSDEFMALLPDLACAEDASLVAAKIMSAVAQPYALSGSPVFCSCSIGIAVADRADVEPAELLHQAGLALHVAKRAEHSTVHYYSAGLAQRVSERLEMRAGLHSAIANREFALHYQPQQDLRRHRIDGVEALLRWHHPQHGLLGPLQFLPAAEETGLIVAIGEWVLEQACTQHRQWLERGIVDCAVSVNISPLQFRRDGFVETVAAVLQRTGLPPQRLELELTESALMNPADGHTVQTLQRLRALGVSLSIDDFGTGLSSLGQLRRLPVDKVKIDRSFIDDITHDGDEAAITLSVISIAHHLGLRVVAEGVQTSAQLAFLKRHQCDVAQGFLVTPALPAPQLEAFVADYRPQSLDAGDGARGPTLLLVDDEPNILRALTRTLRHDGYRILIAHDAEDALQLLAHNEVHVVVSDQRMPGMSGTELLAQVKTLHPHTVRLMLSGYTDLQSVTEAVNRGAIYRFLTKPWDDDALRAHVKEAFLYQQRQHAARP